MFSKLLTIFCIGAICTPCALFSQAIYTFTYSVPSTDQIVITEDSITLTALVPTAGQGFAPVSATGHFSYITNQSSRKILIYGTNFSGPAVFSIINPVVGEANGGPGSVGTAGAGGALTEATSQGSALTLISNISEIAANDGAFTLQMSPTLEDSSEINYNAMLTLILVP